MDPLERRDAPQEHLYRLEEWAIKNFMKFSKDKCKVLRLGKHDPGVQHRMRSTWMESSCVERDLGSWWTSSSIWVNRVQRKLTGC